MNDGGNVELAQAGFADKPVIRTMLQLYLHDFSEFQGWDLNEHGLFYYPYLDQYWVEEGRHPFIIRVNGKLAGFVLVNRHTCTQGAEHSIAEFFVLRKYRRRGVGRMAAHLVFDAFPGGWEVGQTRENVAAQSFWRAVIGEYTGGRYHEYPDGIGEWDGPLQTFTIDKAWAKKQMRDREDLE
jgi:predicted acetyltransferase